MKLHKQQNTIRALIAFGILVTSPMHGADAQSVATDTREVGNAVISGVPDIPADVVSNLERYQNARSALLVDWLDGSLLLETRFGDTYQLHQVDQPGGARHQITFNREPIGAVVVPPLDEPAGFLFTRDIGGSEYYQLFWFDMQSRKSTMLSDGKSRYTGVSFNRAGDMFSYATTERNGRDSDLHARTLSGKKIIIQEDQGIGWTVEDWSGDDTHVLATQYVSITEGYLWEIDVETGDRTQLLQNLGKVALLAAFYGASDEQIYFVSDHDSEFVHLFRFDRDTEEITDLTQEVTWNLESASLSTDRSMLAYSFNHDGYSDLHLVALEDFRELPLPQLPKGRVSGLDFSRDDEQLAFTARTPNTLADVYSIDLKEQTTTRWTYSEIGEIPTEINYDPELIKYASFDGREIPAFVYLPKSEGPHPVLIYIHGGPESQYRPGFSSTFRYMLNELQLAVIAPNVRGSNGYGKTYLQLDNGMKREDSVRDIGALIDWIETQDHLDSERVVVYGGSYGGYMVLASMVHYSDRLAGGIDRFGISNFISFLENTHAYRRDLRRAEYGDERDPEMRAFHERIAPLYNVDKITKPMLISQGLNDPRVPPIESEQIVAALKEAGVPVWYILFKDEGHGWGKKVNRDYESQAIMYFLEQHVVNP